MGLYERDYMGTRAHHFRDIEHRSTLTNSPPRPACSHRSAGTIQTKAMSWLELSAGSGAFILLAGKTQAYEVKTPSIAFWLVALVCVTCLAGKMTFRAGLW